MSLGGGVLGGEASVGVSLGGMSLGAVVVLFVVVVVVEVAGGTAGGGGGTAPVVSTGCPGVGAGVTPRSMSTVPSG
jgi:hypothetical protein